MDRTTLLRTIAATYKNAGRSQPTRAGFKFWESKGEAGLESLRRRLARQTQARPVAAAVIDPATQLATSVASAIPAQSAIPTFEGSGLYNEAAAGQQYEAQFRPYWQRQAGMLDEEKRQALEEMHRNQQDTQGAAAVGGQVGSGVASAQLSQIGDAYKRAYGSPLSGFSERVRGLGDQDVVKRRDYLQQLKDEAYRRYQQRFQTQSAT